MEIKSLSVGNSTYEIPTSGIKIIPINVTEYEENNKNYLQVSNARE